MRAFSIAYPVRLAGRGMCYFNDVLIYLAIVYRILHNNGVKGLSLYAVLRHAACLSDFFMPCIRPKCASRRLRSSREAPVISEMGL